MSFRLALLAALAFSLYGCFNPQIKNLGFACNVSDPGSCPQGYACINGYCDDGSGGPRPGVGGVGAKGDLSQSGAVADMTDTTGGSTDMAMTPVIDMAQPQAVVDMARPVGADMTKLSCQPIGGPCTTRFDCCGATPHCHTGSTHTCF